ncbi:pentapeptide repeat protein (plasmid) [Calothrix sp. NIES-4071]|nr:pentapeptide repeat protein [Calothrix sp. NIES-4071]BAZ64740.1 pentapeptide repeat protein [Calothrix sp. NIES-4105]
MGLGGAIAIPVMIYIFQAGEQRRAEKRAEAEKEAADKRANAEKEIADANLREEALQAYIDRMAEILIDKDRRLELLPDNNNNTHTDNPVRDVARVRTTTILRRLEGDKQRQGHVLDFLRDSELLDFILSGANLSNANLSNANLSGANLSDANLGNANFSNANLSGANLSGANLSYPAYFSGIDLISANLSNANLSGANFSGANLTNVEQIKAAKNWETAKYDSKFRSLLGLPPETP